MFDTIWATLMSLLAVQEVYNWICKPLTLPDNLCCTLCFERALHIQYIRVKHWLPISSHTWVACLLKQTADETQAMSVVQHWGCRWRNAGVMEQWRTEIGHNCPISDGTVLLSDSSKVQLHDQTLSLSLWKRRPITRHYLFNRCFKLMHWVIAAAGYFFLLALLQLLQSESCENQEGAHPSSMLLIFQNQDRHIKLLLLIAILHTLLRG